MNTLRGIHHVTAITSSAEKNYAFFTNILGMRLVKKTVNQDDIQTYHLFFADDRGSAGTDITFFDFPGIPKAVRGTNEIFKTGLRVPSDEALVYWVKRFDKYNVTHSGIYEQFGRKVIDFQDFDEQLYQLVSDEADTGVAPGIPWQKGPVPNEYGIRGLGPIFVRIADFNFYRQVLETVLGFHHAASNGEVHLFEVGEGGNGGRMIVEHNATLGQAQQGFGSVHHMAFRVKDRKELEEWIAHMGSYRFPISGYVDRFYFESLYASIAQGILLEFATDGPGFIDDEEPYETLGERLALPPKFRNNREEIEGLVRQFDTVRSTKTFEKEYLD
ncbi:MAG TPA: VOC family protein [Trichococcus flocculiformis]|nr:VOC family protein [Trichococcus flocculiformis]